MTELRIGAAILREAMQTVEKEDDEALKVKTAKAEEELRKQRVGVLSFIFPPWIFSSFGNSIFFLIGFRQRMRFWMTAKRKGSARSERELFGTSNKRTKTRLSYPRRREEDATRCSVPGQSV